MPLGVSCSNRCDAATNADGGLARAEMLREWAAQEPDADQYQIPNVQGSIPACMRQPALDEGELAYFKDK